VKRNHLVKRNYLVVGTVFETIYLENICDRHVVMRAGNGNFYFGDSYQSSSNHPIIIKCPSNHPSNIQLFNTKDSTYIGHEKCKMESTSLVSRVAYAKRLTIYII